MEGSSSNSSMGMSFAQFRLPDERGQRREHLSVRGGRLGRPAVQSLVQPGLHRVLHEIGRGGLDAAVELLVQLVKLVLDDRLRPARDFRADALPGTVAAQVDLTAPAAGASLVVLLVLALRAGPVREVHGVLAPAASFARHGGEATSATEGRGSLSGS